MLRHYRQALLLRVEGTGGNWEEEDRQCRRLGKVVADLERELFLAGHHRAWGMGAGPCPLCETCNLAGPCRFPRQARPSEVVQTTESPFRLFGLVLVG